MSKFNSIKFRIIAFGVLLVVIGLALRIFFGIPFIRDQITELISAQQMSLATYVAQDVDHSIRSRLAFVSEMATDLPALTITRPDKLSAWLQDRQRANPLFAGLLLVRPDGHGLISEYPALPGREQLDYADVDWFRAAMHSSTPVIGKPMRGRVSGAPLVVMAAAVRDAGGHVVAVLAGFSLLNAPGFLDRLQATPLGASGGFLLISPSDKMFVAASDPSLVLKATPPVGVNLLHDRAMSGFRGTGITINAQGVEEISSMATVTSTGWFLVARMPTEEAFRPITTLRDLTLKSTLIVLVVVIALVTAFLSAVLRPLVNVGRAMREMASGRRALAQLPVHRSDEVGDMVLGFNHLVATLHENEAALRSTVQKLDQLAGTDPLTGAWNRRQFDEMVERELDLAKRYDHPVSLMLLDLDQFKKINDSYGHAKGDDVLQHVANCVRGMLRKSDSLTRWGGEEFMILMPDTGLSNATVLAERMRAGIALDRIDGLGSVTASIGVAEFAASDSRDHWVARADAAMYRAKQAGRNRVEVDSTARELQSIIAESRRAGFVRLIWRDRFCSGNQTLDFQHRGLFDDSNKLLAAILFERSDEEVGAAIDTLMRDIVRHFQDEERLFLECGYPHATVHEAQHAALINSAVELVGQFHRGSLDIGALFRFLARDLVANHILTEDREFFPYLDQSPEADPLRHKVAAVVGSSRDCT